MATPADDGAPSRISWARPLKRVFDIDIEKCPHCGGTLKIIAAIENPAVIAKILAHLGLSARAPPRPPAQAFDPQRAQQGHLRPRSVFDWRSYESLALAFALFRTA